MHDSMPQCGNELEDAPPAGTRATLISAQAADLKDREDNGRSSSKDKSHASGMDVVLINSKMPHKSDPKRCTTAWIL